MRVLIWLLLLATLAAGVSLAAIRNDGYVLLVLPPWRVELSLNLLLILALLGFGLLYALLRGVGGLFALPASVREFHRRRERAKAEAALVDAIRFDYEGRFGRALRSAEQAYGAGHFPLLAALIAQRAAHAMRDAARVGYWRDKARGEDKKSSVARLMVEAGIALDERDYARAGELLDQLASGDGRHVAAQRLALRVNQGLGRWQEVVRLLNRLEKHRATSAEQAASLRRRAYREIVAQLGEQGDALQRFLDSLPARERRDPQLALTGARALTAAGKHEDAARLIEDALDAQWDSELAAAYGDCGNDALARIAHAERWLRAHSRDAELLLTLGRLCRRQQLWGKAQSYLEASLSIRRAQRTHLELATLLDHLGQAGQANAHYRAAAGRT